MADLLLSGPLNLMGNLTLKASNGGKVKIGEIEALVEVVAPTDPNHGTAPPVILPPPPVTPPTDDGPNVWVINSFNKTVKVGTKPIVTQGLVIQGKTPTWPGMVLPSQNNAGPTVVTINHIPINVRKDQAVIFPSGGTAMLNANSGQ